MSSEWIAFLSVMAQSAAALVALVFIAFQIAWERWIGDPMRELVAIQTLLEFLIPGFFAFIALLPLPTPTVGPAHFAAWQAGAVFAGAVGLHAAVRVTRYARQNRPRLDEFGRSQLDLQWWAFSEYGIVLACVPVGIFAPAFGLVAVSVVMIVVLISGSYETWVFFAEPGDPARPTGGRGAVSVRRAARAAARKKRASNGPPVRTFRDPKGRGRS